MATSLQLTGTFDPPLVVPLATMSFEAFREWTRSDDFPERGRIDYVNGRIDVDMSPEKFFSHGKLKTALMLPVNYRIDIDDLGHFLVERSRIVQESVKLSVEPEFLFISYDAIASGRVTFTEAKSDPEDNVEIVGPPDLVCEVVSDSSVTKDTVELFEAYYRTGITEYWLADARRGATEFHIYRRGDAGYEPIPTDTEGFVRSQVLGHSYRLTRSTDRNGMAKFRLEER